MVEPHERLKHAGVCALIIVIPTSGPPDTWGGRQEVRDSLLDSVLDQDDPRLDGLDLVLNLIVIKGMFSFARLCCCGLESKSLRGDRDWAGQARAGLDSWFYLAGST